MLRLRIAVWTGVTRDTRPKAGFGGPIVLRCEMHLFDHLGAAGRTQPLPAAESAGSGPPLSSYITDNIKVPLIAEAQIVTPSRFALLRLCLVALEAVSLERLEGRIGADEVEPRTRRLRMRGVRYNSGAVDRECIVRDGYVDVTDGIADFFLKNRFRLPCDARLGEMLRQKKRRLAVMDAGGCG
jgi:hypothetical protein